MKEIGKLINLDTDINQKVEVIKKQVLSNQKLLSYCKKHKIELTDIKINNSLMNLLNFSENHEKCLNCTGLDNCQQLNLGFQPILKDYQTFVNIQYIACHYQKAYDAQVEITNHLKCFHMPKKILSASLDHIDLNSSRAKSVSRLATFAKSYTPEKFQKGVFLTGAFGIGKTYLLAAMANALAKRHIQVALVYLPDMIRELKSAIGKNNLEYLMSEIKNVQVLILDDIGSEMNTQWVRDEILGPILQYRMLEELPTFFSSNKTIKELITDYATTNDHVVSVSKAERIGDRIKALADEIVLTGKNYRY
ncbi:primosomal protein DnaI [Mycoplasmatota bacterium]|nr:primosomal protein DnaI [Mycoplasmatota bacterium]